MIDGGSGDDILSGSKARDRIDGGRGSDRTMCGRSVPGISMRGPAARLPISGSGSLPSPASLPRPCTTAACTTKAADSLPKCSSSLATSHSFSICNIAVIAEPRNLGPNKSACVYTVRYSNIRPVGNPPRPSGRVTFFCRPNSMSV